MEPGGVDAVLVHLPTRSAPAAAANQGLRVWQSNKRKYRQLSGTAACTALIAISACNVAIAKAVTSLQVSDSAGSEQRK